MKYMSDSEESLMDDEYKYKQLSELSMVDRIRMKKIYVTLENAEGEDVPVREVLSKLTEFLRDQLSDKEPNGTLTKVYPLLCQSMSTTLMDVIGDRAHAMLILAQDVTRTAFVNEMTLGFYLSRFMEKNNLKIVTTEEELTQEELDRILRLNKAASVTALAALAGENGVEVIKQMIKSGALTKEDIKSAGVDIGDMLTEDDKDDKGN